MRAALQEEARLKALLEEAGSEGLTHAEISERLTDVAANTLNTYLSVMANSGELERYGDKYRAGAPAAAPYKTKKLPRTTRKTTRLLRLLSSAVHASAALLV